MTEYKRDYMGSADALNIHNGLYESLIKSKMRQSDFVNPCMSRGILLEPDVIDQYADELGITEYSMQVKKTGDIEHCFSALDAEATMKNGSKEIWEVKTSKHDAPKDEAELKKKYRKYWYQVQWQMWTARNHKAKVLWCKCPPVEEGESPYDENGKLNIYPIKVKYCRRVTQVFEKNAPIFWEMWEEAKLEGEKNGSEQE